MLLLSWVLAADVIEEVENGHIDWTHSMLVVEATGGQNTGAWSDTKLVEQTAVSQLELRVRQTAMALPYDDARRAEDLSETEGVGSALDEGLAGWAIAETRYYTSGKVQLRAEVDLQDWLRPALVAEAEGDPDGVRQPTEITGIVIDARGLDVRPTLAPKVLAPGTQELIYSGAFLTPEAAAASVPVIWVTDPADAEAIARAGAQPAVLDVEAVRGGSDLILRADDASQLRAIGLNSDLLRTGRVVVVVDP